MSKLDPQQLRIATKKVRSYLTQLVREKGPIDIDSIYEEVERNDDCTPWRRHHWESCPHTGPKGAVQAEWKHKIRTYLQAREHGQKLFKYEKGAGWLSNPDVG